MNVNVDIKFSTEIEPWLCFRHAVLGAMKGFHVLVEADDFLNEYHMGPTACTVCNRKVRDTP